MTIAAHQARDLATLQSIVASGARIKQLAFWGHTPRGGATVGPWVFSQWFEAPTEVDGIRYPTAEHWMMAHKARLFDDTTRLQQILDAPHPGAAKQHGRQVVGFDQARWVEARFEIVVQGNLHKFSQHPELGAYLAGTNKRVLVEASPVDRIWGVGLAADDPKIDDPRTWQGPNLLGFALMEVRARLGEHQSSSA